MKENNSTFMPFKLMEKYNDKLVSIIFWLFCIIFVVDQIANYFFHLQVFVISALLVFPFLFSLTLYNTKNKQQLYVLVFSFIALTIINSIVFAFDLKNISDLLFIVLLITFYFYYKNNIRSINISNVYLFLILSVFLFSFTFIGIDSDYQTVLKNKSSLNSYNSTDSELNYLSDKAEVASAKSDVQSNISKNEETTKWEPKSIYVLKKHRVYHKGLFRVSHVASYFFGFLFLFFSFLYQKNKKLLNLVLLFISLGLSVYTGSKTIMLAIALSLLAFLLIRKNILYSIMVLMVVVLIVYAREYILQITENTILYPYSVLVYISVENLTAISRFQIWNSWWIEVSEFGFWDFAIGKSFANVFISNQKNLDLKIWFHNDFLNIFYTYGIVGITLYVGFFVKVYRDNKEVIKQNIFIFIFYFSMIFTSFINGFYYYFPVFLLYLFFLMIKTEKQQIQPI